MSRLPQPVRAKAVLGAVLLTLATGLAACDEDGKTAPARCGDPALPVFDIQTAGAPADDNVQYPCVTPVGHAVSGTATPAPTAGTSSGGSATAGSSGTATVDAGAGGVGGASGAGGAP